MEPRRTAGHLAALITILIWGTTFLSTKVLLAVLQPVEILFFRFLLGLLALLLACPRRLKGTTRRQELTFAGAGLCGVCLYYLLENVALTYTLASNVGVILSVAPFFTALLSHRSADRAGLLGPGFVAGFGVAMAGIVLLSVSDSAVRINPAGDLLALLAAFVWACYSLLSRKIGSYGYPVLLTTRRVFCYGLLFLLPALPLSGFRWDLERLAEPVYGLNLLFLGLGASALCFVTWNVAVERLGAVRTSLYIYLVPVITVAASALILGEPVTGRTVAGTALTLAGLLLSEHRAGRKGETSYESGN